MAIGHMPRVQFVEDLHRKIRDDAVEQSWARVREINITNDSIDVSFRLEGYKGLTLLCARLLTEFAQEKMAHHIDISTPMNVPNSLLRFANIKLTFDRNYDLELVQE